MIEVMRQEKKYLITLTGMHDLSHRLEQMMIRDPHGDSQGYRIRSLYFDTLNEEDYFSKVDGMELRRKLRLRIYDTDADFAMLEMKQKQGAYQKKRSLRLSREAAEQLAAGRYDMLLTYPEPFAAECYGLMNRLCYRPKTVVEYHRQAFIARENHIRITLDHHITATESCMDLFSPNLSLSPVLDPFQVVLEVKYDGFLLSYVKSMVSQADCSELSVSKYCLARSTGLKFQL